MAQHPPKAPNTTTMSNNNWPYFVHPPGPSPALVPQHFFPAFGAGGGGGGGSQPSWTDEFLDFSAARRSQHRRATADSGAFLGGADFDRLDDDQLMSMFSDEGAPPPPPSFSSVVPASSPATSTRSDHNSVHDDKPAAAANRPEEAQSACKAEKEAAAAAAPEQILDPKRVRRILSNRQSAQRSRVRKLRYISDLERSVATLQSEVSALSPRVAFLDQQRSVLTMGNSHLKQRIAALAQDEIFNDAHQQALRKQVERLRRVYHQQNLDKMEASNTEPMT